MGILVYRIQDREGRGPYRPGVQRFWMDPDHDARNPTFLDEFGVGVCVKLTGYAGCGFADLEQAARWFSAMEILKIASLDVHGGYQLVRIQPDEVIARSSRQLLFTRKKPLNQSVEILAWQDLVRRVSA